MLWDPRSWDTAVAKHLFQEQKMPYQHKQQYFTTIPEVPLDPLKQHLLSADMVQLTQGYTGNIHNVSSSLLVTAS